MASKSKRFILHPDAPNRLKRELRAAGSFQKLADKKGVNVRYVYDLLTKGIEPSNPTIAHALYVDQKPTARLALGDRRFRHIRWWKRLTRAQRNELIHFLYHYKERG